MGREGKNWRGLEPEDDVITTCDKTHASQRYLQAAEDLVVVRDVLSRFSKIENLFFFRGSEEVCDVSISWSYILLSVADNFGLGKWVKIERNDGKLLRV